MHVCAISKETARKWGNLCGTIAFAGVFIAFIAGLAYRFGNNPPGSWDALVSGCVIFGVGLFGVIVSTMV